jgi:AcrR family transcriptional regulator
MQQILGAALKVYRARGYHGAEIGEIARVAGLGRGLIYYYFRNKKELFLTLIRRTVEEWQERAKGILNADLPVAERLAQYLKEMCLLALQHPDITYFHTTISRNLRVVFPNEAAEVMSLYERYIFLPFRRLIEEGVRKGELRDVDPRVAERMFFSVLFGALDNENMITTEHIDPLVEITLFGLVKTDGSSDDF